jgi:hypothetical protein
MARTAKRLYQGAQSTTATTRYTAPASTTGQITEIYLANTGSTARTVTLYQGGTANSNMLMQIPVPANGGVILEDKKIVVVAAQTFAAKQDVGTDITMTLYGVEEV